MKEKAILIFAILLFKLGAAADRKQFNLKIELKTTDCINCISYIQLLTKINNNVCISILFKNNRDSLVISELLNNFEKLPPYKFELIDSKFESNGSKSIFYFFKNTILIKSENLSNLEENIVFINLLSSEKPKLNIDSTIINPVFSEKSQLIVLGNKKFIFDPFLNKIFVSEVVNNNYSLFYKSNSNYNLELCKIANLDTTRYLNFIPILKRFGKSNIKMNAISLYGGEIWSTATLSYPIINKSDTIIENFFFLLNIEKERIKKAYYIKDSTLSNNSDYYFDDSNAFVYSDSSIILTIYKENFTSNNYILSDWKLSEKNLIFHSLSKFELPNYYKVNNHKNYNFAGLGCNSDILFLINYPSVYSLDKKTTFDYKKVIESIEAVKIEKEKIPKLYIYDCLVENDLYSIAYNLNGKIKIIIVKSEGSLISVFDIPNYNCKNLKFIKKNHLLGINSNNGKEYTIILNAESK
jgi:hypothetical protein